MKIIWLSDAGSPYRIPLWRELSALATLDIRFCFREEKVRHWTWAPHPDYRSAVIGAWTVPLPRAVARRLDAPAAMLRPGVARRLLDGMDALVIQNWWQPANLSCIWLATRRGIPYLLYAESTLQSRRFRRGPLAWLRSLVFRHAGAVIVPGPAAAEAAIHDGTPVLRIVESVNSIELDRRVRELRGESAQDPEHRFVYIGQLIERKNVVALVQAFATLDPKATLDIAGDGVEMAGLVALVNQLDVADRVTFHGYLEELDVAALLAETHTLVLPSTEEVYGFTALEAFVAGLQVIVSDVAGIASNLRGRPGVWVVPPDEVNLGRAMGEAKDAWSGWNDDVDTEFASPRRAARDIVHAAELARRLSGGRA